MPSGSRNWTERFPHGISFGSWTTFTLSLSRVYSALTSSTMNSTIAVRLAAGWALPSLKRGTVASLPMARVAAVVLGAQWVMGRRDSILSSAAHDVIAKIAAVIPERLRPYIVEPSVGAKPSTMTPADAIDTSELRRAVREGRKPRLRYRSDAEQETERTVWPVILGYGETTQLIVAWCELRSDFRRFRADRVIEAEVLEEKTGLSVGELRHRWQRWRETQVF